MKTKLIPALSILLLGALFLLLAAMPSSEKSAEKYRPPGLVLGFLAMAALAALMALLLIAVILALP